MMTLRYQERCISRDSLSFCKDLKIIGDKFVEDWWRAEGHRVDTADIADILAASPNVLVVGTGYAGFMELSRSLDSALKDHNIKLIAQKTPQAVKTFNELHSRGKRVAAAFHLTC
ncbi:MAG: Mth938-like domain-containing protein [bacterium]